MTTYQLFGCNRMVTDLFPQGKVFPVFQIKHQRTVFSLVFDANVSEEIVQLVLSIYGKLVYLTRREFQVFSFRHSQAKLFLESFPNVFSYRFCAADSWSTFLSFMIGRGGGRFQRWLLWNDN